ncbi:MAG: hypothetical protein OIF56_02340 [Cohaesibacter sp.]|nr:hypothetical protein [Cohaesibacter sp.]
MFAEITLDKAVEVQRDRVIWQKCFDKKVCVNLPIVGKKCIGASACIRIIESDKNFFIELQIGSEKIRYKLASTCLPAYTIGIASLTVCANVGANKVCLSVKFCIGTRIAGIKVGHCWNLYQGCINFFRLGEINQLDFATSDINMRELSEEAQRIGVDYAYFEEVFVEDQLVSTDFNPAKALKKMS